MTPKQREMARHALGLTRNKVSYRNRYVVGDGAPEHGAWLGLVESGLARMRRGNPLTGGYDCFWLTRAGAEAALNPGETLDPEDFPQ